MKLKNILLAEDSPMDVELTMEALQEHHHITVVEDGEAAIDICTTVALLRNATPATPT